MPSVFETVTFLLRQSDNRGKLGTVVGVDPDTLDRLVGAAAPALLDGIADKAAEPGGIRVVMRLIDGMDDAPVSNPGRFLDEANPGVGVGMLSDVFGDDPSDLVGALTGRTGAEPTTISRLLPMLVPMVMGILRYRRLLDGLDGSGLMALLAREKSTLSENGLLHEGSKSMVGVGAAVVAGARGATPGAIIRMRRETGSSVDAPPAVPEETSNNATAPPTTPEQPAEATPPAAPKQPPEATTPPTTPEQPAEAVAGDVMTDAAGSVTGPIRGSGGPGNGLLPLVLGGLAAVLVLAWALSQCGGDEDSGPDGDGAQVEQTDDAATGAIESSVVATDDDGAAETPATDDRAPDGQAPTGQNGDIAALQTEIDAVLSNRDLAGLAAVIRDDGIVTLAGTVTDDETKAEAEAAVTGIDGIAGVDNQIVVDPGANDTTTEPSTLNEELDLEPITFEVLSSRITAEGTAVLDEAAAYLAANADVDVEIAGHTDADGDEAANLALSQARAEVVKAYLEARGIDGSRLTPTGYGETQPIGSNDTAEGKARNRRIEFVIR